MKSRKSLKFCKIHGDICFLERKILRILRLHFHNNIICTHLYFQCGSKIIFLHCTKKRDLIPPHCSTVPLTFVSPPSIAAQCTKLMHTKRNSNGRTSTHLTAAHVIFQFPPKLHGGNS